MHICRIVIENFRNFAQVDLRDLPPAHVLVGENGVGKTNLLYALRLVLDPSLPDVYRQLSAEDFWDGLSAPFDGHEVRVAIELTGFDNDATAVAYLDDYLVDRSPSVARLTYLFRPEPDPTGIGAPARHAHPSGYEFVRFGGDGRGVPLHGSVLRYLGLRVLPALRDAEGELSSRRSPLRAILDQIAIDGASLKAAASHISDASGALLGDPNIDRVRSDLNDRIDNMVGSTFALQTTLGIAAPDAERLAQSIHLLIDGAKQRPIGHESLGSANVLYLALLLELFKQQAEGDVAANILGVEEPEAHLHPHLQRVLFRHLLDTERATIVTTHSPHLASVTPLKSITLMNQNQTSTHCSHARSLGLTETETKDLERYLDVTRAEVLFAKAVILVEGAAEQFLVPAFAASLGIDLDQLGITVCSVHGTDFKPYTRLLGQDGLSVPHAVLTDGDEANGAHPGIDRGIRLLEDRGIGHRARRMFGRSFNQAAKTLLTTHGIFVGASTLEVDLIHTGSAAMVEAHRDLVDGESARSNFAEAIDKATAGDLSSAEFVLARIGELGKGRYAQRLASYVEPGMTPSYIESAIRCVAEGYSTEQ